MTGKDLLESLDRYRAAHNLDWGDIARTLCVTKQTVSNWRAGKSAIRAKSRRGIAVMITEDQPPVTDGVLLRIIEIYNHLDGESRALLLAAAERLDRGEQEISALDLAGRKAL